MICPRCKSQSVAKAPAEIRLYRNCTRRLSLPPLTPAPEVLLCADCGWAEFQIPQEWMAAGWLRQSKVVNASSDSATSEPRLVMLPRKAPAASGIEAYRNSKLSLTVWHV